MLWSGIDRYSHEKVPAEGHLWESLLLVWGLCTAGGHSRMAPPDCVLGDSGGRHFSLQGNQAASNRWWIRSPCLLTWI